MTPQATTRAVDLPLERRRGDSPMRVTAPGPLFVLGAARSSQTLLAAALAQHPAVRLVLDTSWVPALAGALDGAHETASAIGNRSARASAQVARPDLLAAVGTALAGLLPPGGARVAGTWVTSATITSAREVTWLLELFPTARVVHLLRHPDAVVRSLATQACGDGRYASPASGYRGWAESVAALVDAEHTHGSDRVLRLTVEELHADPDTSLSRCLAHLDLPPHGPCAAVLRGVATDAPGADLQAGEDRAIALSWYEQLAGAGAGTAGPARTEPAAAKTPTKTPTAAPRADIPQPYQQLVSLALPAGATAAVLSKGDPTLVTVPGRSCWHLPRTDDGRYAGFHPANSREVLAHLRTAVRDGARYLVVPGASSWWLQHYTGLADHLHSRARLVAHHEDIATVYALTVEGAAP